MPRRPDRLRSRFRRDTRSLATCSRDHRSLRTRETEKGHVPNLLEGGRPMRLSRVNRVWLLSGLAAAVAALAIWGLVATRASSAQKDDAPKKEEDPFAATMAKMKADKPK